MTNLFRAVRAPLGLRIVSLLCVVGGCGGGKGADSDGSAPADGPDAGVSACPGGGGAGTLSVKIHGAPTTGGSVTVTAGGAGATTQTVTADMDLTEPAGVFTLSAARVAAPGTLVRTAYEPSIDTVAPCVHASQTTTVNVTYSAVASSHRLWVGNSQETATLLGYDPTVLSASGAPAATAATDTKGSDGFTFDRAGNVWVLGATTGDPPLARYAAAMFASSGAKTADVIIDSPAFAGGVPGAKVIAFDAAGNLWVSVVWANKVARFTPAQLAVSGSPTPAVEIGGLSGPSGIAFDAAGNMFVASTGNDEIIRVDQAHLATSGSTADLTLTGLTPAPVIGDLSAPTGLAFDATGGLWADFDGSIVRFTPADLAGAGSKMVTPAVQISLDVLALSEGIAFDEGGGLWVAFSAGKFVRLSPAQLATSGVVTPATVISSGDVGYAGWFAIYPAPAATPLFHRLP